MLTQTLFSLLPLISFSLATPTPGVGGTISPDMSRRRTTTPLNATATIISYFVATACDSEFSQATQTLTGNVCMDLGEDDTTRSIAIYDVLINGSNSTITVGGGETKCTVQVWEDEKCGSTETETVAMGVGSTEADKTCVDEPSWGDGSTMMGSVMLTCT